MSSGNGLHTYLRKSMCTDESYGRGEPDCDGSTENDRTQGVADRKWRLVNY